MNTSISMISTSDRNLGAIRVSLFFALWTGALFALQELRVEAAPVLVAPTQQTAWWMAPPAAPQIDSRSFWQGIAEHSEVMGGGWQPAIESGKDSTPTEPTSSNEPMAAVHETGQAPASNEPAIPASDADASTPAPTPVTRTALRIERVTAAESANDLARAAIARGDDEGAYGILQTAAVKSQPDSEHYDLLAAVMVRTGRYEAAADVYAALLATDASNPRLWAGYAITLERIGRAEPSQLAYRNLLRTAVAGSALHTLAQTRLHGLG
jgi:tetratricopeptide (TPR) repeat protein